MELDISLGHSTGRKSVTKLDNEPVGVRELGSIVLVSLMNEDVAAV